MLCAASCQRIRRWTGLSEDGQAYQKMYIQAEEAVDITEYKGFKKYTEASEAKK